MSPSDIPVPQKGFLVAHFLTVKDQAKSKEFYVGVLGGQIVNEENPCYTKLENSWIILNSGGGPTPDKPDVSLAPPHDLNSVSSFLNLRVADIRACASHESAMAGTPAPPIIKMARELGLDPCPAGHNDSVWMADCPRGSHWIMISPSHNEFNCGYCRHRGGPAELQMFYDSIRGKKRPV